MASGSGRCLGQVVSSWYHPLFLFNDHGDCLAAKLRPGNVSSADDWEELELPVRAMKPEIIDAIDQAQQLRIFDALGIAPNYRSADPVICGQIRRPEGPGVLTFFIAWWLDESDL